MSFLQNKSTQSSSKLRDSINSFNTKLAKATNAVTNAVTNTATNTVMNAKVTNTAKNTAAKITVTNKVVNHSSLFPVNDNKSQSSTMWMDNTNWFLKIVILISIFLFLIVLSFEIYDRQFNPLMILFIIIIGILVTYSITCMVEDCYDLSWTWMMVALLFASIILTTIILAKNRSFKKLIEKKEKTT